MNAIKSKKLKTVTARNIESVDFISYPMSKLFTKPKPSMKDLNLELREHGVRQKILEKFKSKGYTYFSCGKGVTGGTFDSLVVFVLVFLKSKSFVHTKKIATVWDKTYYALHLAMVAGRDKNLLGYYSPEGFLETLSCSGVQLNEPVRLGEFLEFWSKKP